MIRTASLAFVVTALLVAAGLAPGTGEAPVAAPFWQLHGAVPAAHDPAALEQLRVAARHPEGQPLVLAFVRAQ